MARNPSTSYLARQLSFYKPRKPSPNPRESYADVTASYSGVEHFAMCVSMATALLLSVLVCDFLLKNLKLPVHWASHQDKAMPC